MREYSGTFFTAAFGKADLVVPVTDLPHP